MQQKNDAALYMYVQYNELIKNTFPMMCTHFESRTCSNVCFSTLFFSPPAPPRPARFRPRLLNLLHIGKDILKYVFFTSLFLFPRIPHHPKRSQSSLA